MRLADPAMSSQQPPTDVQQREQEKPSVPHWTHGYTVVPLDDDCWEIVDLVADARASSYEDGRTTDVLLGDPNTQQKHVTGVAGEVATAMALDIPVLEALDLSISADGDDGVDLKLRRGVQGRSIDIKAHWSPPTGRAPQLLVEREKAETADTDAYVFCQCWDADYAVVHGWATAEELLERGWIEGPPKWEQQNWTMTADMLRPISELRTWADGTGWDW